MNHFTHPSPKQIAQSLMDRFEGDARLAHEYCARANYGVAVVLELRARRYEQDQEHMARVGPALRKGWDEFFAAGGKVPS